MGFFKKDKKDFVDIQPNCDGLILAIDNAHDVAVMRYVLLQFVNWFKTGCKTLPFMEKDPFVDDWCNVMTREIYRYMSDITKKQEGKNKNEI